MITYVKFRTSKRAKRRRPIHMDHFIVPQKNIHIRFHKVVTHVSIVSNNVLFSLSMRNLFVMGCETT